MTQFKIGEKYIVIIVYAPPFWTWDDEIVI